MATNKAIVEIEVDPNGRGMAAIRGINTSLGSLGVTAPGVAQNVSGVGRSIDLLGGAIAGAGVAHFTGEIIGAGKQASDANRLISASAKEAGLAYELVTEKAERFAARTSQAEVAAQRTYASILQFTKAAGQTERVDEFTTAFADLAAARGIQAAQLGDIARQLQALTDEATDKLLGANPSAFFERYAQSIGKTAGALTDAEKRASILDEVIRRGALFSGEADRRLGDVAGKLDTVAAKIENLKAAAGKAATAKGGPLDALLSGALFGLDTFRGGGAFADTGDGKGVNLLLAEGEQRAKLVVEQLREQERKVAEALREPFGSFENLVLSRAAPKISVFDQDPAAREQIFQQARDEALALRDRLKKTIEETLKDDATPISVLKLARTQLDIFDPEDERKFAQAIEEAIKKRVEALTKPIQELRAETSRLLADMTARAEAANPFVRFFNQADASAKSFARTTAELRERYGELAEGVIGQLEKITAAQRAAIAEGALEQRFGDQLQALSLRQEAEALRRGGDGGLQARLDRDEKELGVTRLDVLANLLREIDSGRVFTSSAQGALAIFGQGGEDAAPVRNAQEAIERIRAIQADALARSFDPATAQRLADKFALDATGRLGADALRDSPELRQLRIDALDRSASRLGSREEEARARSVEDLKSRERLSTELDRLTRAVERNSEKLDKGAFTFRFRDETGGRLALDGALGEAPTAEPSSPGYAPGWRY